MPLKYVVMKFTPPIIQTIWVRLKYKMHYRIYKQKANYDNIEIADVVARKNAIYKLSTENLRQDSEDTAAFFSSLWFLDKFYKKEKYQILDFGGGGRGHFFRLKSRVWDSIGAWTVVETPSMVEMCKNLEESKLNFCTLDDIEMESLYLDLIYSSCALQYTESPEETLLHLLHMKAKTICFSRIVLNTDDSEVKIIEVSKLGNNGPILPDGNFGDKNISYKSVAMPQKLFEKKIEEDYIIKLRIENTTTQAYKAAGAKNTRAMTYIAVLNPNRTLMTESTI